ncbi:MAG: polysaccharide deacetylase family protein [Clostridia bacterium]|nr:polysaccharide deacetylase family protein [Clostridia bacterium]
MRKYILTCLTAACLTLPCLASGTGWYFHHSKNGEQMPPPPELAYIEQYDGFYADRNHASMEDDDRVLYLTFDAGYENGNVGAILDILKEENVPGAFFILEGLVKTEPELVRRMGDEGHLVCNHTASHRDMTKVETLEGFRAELVRMEDVYRESTGREIARFYRPPEGKISEENMRFAKECGYSTVFWSFAYADWDNGRQMDPEAAKARILAETHNGEVLLLHPTSATNAAILRDLIRTWKEMGFRFGTLEEIRSKM